jgi:hypothetical protein
MRITVTSHQNGAWPVVAVSQLRPMRERMICDSGPGMDGLLALLFSEALH